MVEYAAGLRVGEVIVLRVTDIDSSRMVIRVNEGKGGNDRYVILSQRLLLVLREYWKAARPKDFLFLAPARPATSPTPPFIGHVCGPRRTPD